MFAKILQFIRELYAKMIGQSTVTQVLKVPIAISSEMANALQLWSALYENRAPWLNADIKSLNLPAAIAGELARAATIEMKVEFTGSARAKFLESQFMRLMPKLRAQVEYGLAKGGLVMKPYVDGDRLAVDFVHADQFYPVSFDADGEIAACVFADSRTVGDKYYTRLEFHQMTEAGCEIRNMAYRSSSKDTLGVRVPLDVIDDWASLEPEAVITGIDKPLFAYFKFPMANNVDATSPLGVSCYSRAVDLIRDADIQWSNLLWEFESGQRALYADVLAYGRDRDGNPVLPHKRLYRALNGGGNIGEEGMFHEWTPSLREENILRGLDAILKRIEYACGLAYGTLSDPASVEKTATEIKASKQRTYATVTDTQKALQSALEHLIWAMDVWTTIGGLAPAGAYAVTFDFDDSVIVDRDMQFQQDLRLVAQGIMSKAEFRVRNFKEKEDVAKAKIAEALAERPPEESIFGVLGAIAPDEE